MSDEARRAALQDGLISTTAAAENGKSTTPARSVVRLRASPLAPRLMAVFATVCGALASNSLPWERPEWVKLLLSILLIDAGWGALWDSVGGTDWAAVVRQWQEWPVGGKIAWLPYAQEGSRGDRLSRWLGQLRAWWRQALWPTCGNSIAAAAQALALSGLLAVVLGPHAVLLTVAAIAVVQLGVVCDHGRGSPSPVFDSALRLLLPWLLAYGGLAPFSPGAVLLAGLLALVYGSVRTSQRSLAYAGLLSSIAALVIFVLVAERPVAAVAIGVLMLPQLLLVPWLRRGFPLPRLVSHARPWIAVVMLTAALVL